MTTEALLLQIIVGLCFLGLVIVLFFEDADYLTYSILLVLIAVLATQWLYHEPLEVEDYVVAIDWEVIFFLISMFVIVEILNDQRVFHEIARLIVEKYKDNIRKLFWVLCSISTLIAALIEDLSVAMIFIPIIILTCKQLNINPAPFLLGMTICINLAATLTPFGSAQNIMIANYYDLSVLWFLQTFAPFFIIATFLTLLFLDLFILKKETSQAWVGACEDHDTPGEIHLSSFKISPSVFKKNFIALGFFIGLLLLIPIHIAGLIGMLIFVFLNPIAPEKAKKVQKPTEVIENSDGDSVIVPHIFETSQRPRVSYYFRKVDYKLIYFFMTLFILVYLMEINGTVDIFDNLLENISFDNVFVLSVVVLISTSLLSGLMDNAPVTIIFLPIIEILMGHGYPQAPLLLAFVMGINLGGNFLPQGSAADMLTLEMAQQNCVESLNFKRLFKVGGSFALLHILIGIVYIAFLVFVFPGY